MSALGLFHVAIRTADLAATGSQVLPKAERAGSVAPSVQGRGS
jgi:hypothetical protein